MCSNLRSFLFACFPQVGLIDACLLQATASRVVPVNGMPCEVKVYDICDPTGQTSLSLWEQQILSAKEGQLYRFQALATRKEGDRTVLTSTPSTVMTAIAEVGKPPTVTVSTKREHAVRGEVMGVQILARPRCRRCHASQDSVAPRCTTQRIFVFICTSKPLKKVAALKCCQCALLGTYNNAYSLYFDKYLCDCVM